MWLPWWYFHCLELHFWSTVTVILVGALHPSRCTLEVLQEGSPWNPIKTCQKAGKWLWCSQVPRKKQKKQLIRQSFSPYSMAILRYNIYIHMHIPIYTPFWSPYGSWSHVLMSPRLLWLDQRSSSQGDGDPQAAEDPHATNWSWKLQNLHSHVVYNIYNRLSILVYTYMKKRMLKFWIQSHEFSGTEEFPLFRKSSIIEDFLCYT